MEGEGVVVYKSFDLKTISEKLVPLVLCNGYQLGLVIGK